MVRGVVRGVVKGVVAPVLECLVLLVAAVSVVLR